MVIALLAVAAIAIGAIVPAFASGQTSTANIYTTSMTYGSYTTDTATSCYGYISCGPRASTVYGYFQYNNGINGGSTSVYDTTGSGTTKNFSGSSSGLWTRWRTAGYCAYSGSSAVCRLTTN